MGADEDVDLALLEVFQQGRRLLRRAGPRQVVDAHGHVFQPALEGAEVLIGQHRRGHENGHLLAVDGGLEGGPDGHLGLAEADVAADQAVHGLGALHVGLDVLRGLELVGCVLIEE